jgi:hypothetical protein
MFLWVAAFLIIVSSVLGTNVHAADTDDFAFAIPSSLSATFGGSNQDARNSSIQANLTLPHNWQVGGGVDRGLAPGENDGETLSSKGYNLSVASDPLATLSGQLSIETWKLEEEVDSRGGLAQISWARDQWLWSVEGGYARMLFSDLPRIIWSDRESEVEHAQVGFAVENNSFHRLTLRLAGAQHTYSQDLTDYSEGLRVLVMPSSVLTTVSGLVASEGSLSATYALNKFSFGALVGASTSALDSVRTRQLGASATVKISKSWSSMLQVNFYRPEDATESDGTTSAGNFTVTFFW